MNFLFKKNIKKTFFIAEIGVNHCGNINLAKKMVLAAKKAGADAVKFQTFKATSLVTPDTPKVKYQLSTTNKNENHYEMIKSLEFSKENHIIIKKFCKKKRIFFLSTPYDTESAKFLSSINCKVFKTASADIVDLALHKYLAKNKKSVIISTGMATLLEIKKCLDIYKKYKNKNYILLHCVSNYPCSKESLNLSVIPIMRSMFGCNIGYSDHTLSYMSSLLSVGLGAKVIEKHFTINKKLPGPDHKASATPLEFSLLVNKIREAEIMLGKNKKILQNEEKEMAKISRKSLTLFKSVKKNHKFSEVDFVLKRPGTGLYYENLKYLIGKKAKKNLSENYQIKFKDLL